MLEWVYRMGSPCCRGISLSPSCVCLHSLDYLHTEHVMYYHGIILYVCGWCFCAMTQHTRRQGSAEKFAQTMCECATKRLCVRKPSVYAVHRAYRPTGKKNAQTFIRVSCTLYSFSCLTHSHSISVFCARRRANSKVFPSLSRCFGTRHTHRHRTHNTHARAAKWMDQNAQMHIIHRWQWLTWQCHFIKHTHTEVIVVLEYFF